MTRFSIPQSSAHGACLGCEVGALRRIEAAPRVAEWPPTGPHATEAWAEAYSELEFELASLRRDNDALLAEVRGRRRTQHGRRSERVTPEELLVGLRELVETEPFLVPPGMLEELEQECAERARLRERRKAQRALKLARRAEAAARQAAAKHGKPPSPPNDDDDGGGGGQPTAKGRADNTQTNADIIEIRRGSGSARRNACLAGMAAEVTIEQVPASEQTCPQCNGPRQIIGYETSEMLDMVLPRLRRLQRRCEKRACPLHPTAGVVTAVAPQRPLPQRLPTALLLAFVIVAKVADHLPLERLSGILQRWGTRVPPSTLGGWLHAAAELLAPIAEHLGKKVLASSQCLHTDGSHLRVLDPSKPGGSTQAGLWGYTVRGLGTYFRVTKDQAFADTRDQLADRRGPTITDGHRGYVSQRRPGSKCAVAVLEGPHLHCWAHARRPFEQAHRQDGDRRAIVIMRLIQRLYAVEAWLRKKPRTIEEIALVRAARSVPILETLFAHLGAMQGHVPPKSRLGQAIATTLRRRPHLEAYALTGSCPIDNTEQERQFRGKALGQHNWLFVGTHAAAQRYAVLLTLVQSCVLTGADPVAYLAEVVLRVQERGSSRDMDALLPAAFVQRKTNQMDAA